MTSTGPCYYFDALKKEFPLRKFPVSTFCIDTENNTKDMWTSFYDTQDVSTNRNPYQRQHSAPEYAYASLYFTLPDITSSLQNPVNNVKRLEKWVYVAKAYGDSIHRTFQQQCDKRIQILERMKKQDALRKRFSLEKLAELPVELLHVIYKYLPYDIKFQYLQSEYSHWKESIMKNMNAGALKTFCSNLRKHYRIDSWYYTHSYLYRTSIYNANNEDALLRRLVKSKPEGVRYIQSLLREYNEIKYPLHANENKEYIGLTKKAYSLMLLIIRVSGVQKDKCRDVVDTNKEIKKKKTKRSAPSDIPLSNDIIEVVPLT